MDFDPMLVGGSRHIYGSERGSRRHESSERGSRRNERYVHGSERGSRRYESSERGSRRRHESSERGARRDKMYREQPVTAKMPASATCTSYEFFPNRPIQLRDYVTKEQYAITVEEINVMLKRKPPIFYVLLAVTPLFVAVGIAGVVLSDPSTRPNTLSVVGGVGFILAVVSLSAAFCTISTHNRLKEVNNYLSTLKSSWSWRVAEETKVIGQEYNAHGSHHGYQGHFDAYSSPVERKTLYLIVER